MERNALGRSLVGAQAEIVSSIIIPHVWMCGIWDSFLPLPACKVSPVLLTMFWPLDHDCTHVMMHSCITEPLRGYLILISTIHRAYGLSFGVEPVLTLGQCACQYTGRYMYRKMDGSLDNYL